MGKRFTLSKSCCFSIPHWRLALFFFAISFLMQFLVVTAAAAQSCTPISTLTCDRVTVPLPVNLAFGSGVPGTIADKNGVGTGFTMVDAHSGTRHSADGGPSNPSVPGFESSKLTVTGGRMQIVTNKGIASTTSNNQLNALGVQVDSRQKLQAEVTLVNPYYGTSFQQGGLWFGLNDQSFIKLVVTANKVELRREVNDVTGTSDQRITGTISGLNTSTVRLRLVVDPAASTVQGFYSTNGGTTFQSVGTALSIAGMGLTASTAYAGIFATHRNGTSPVTYTFDDFSVTGSTSSGNNVPVFTSDSYSYSNADDVALGAAVGSVKATDADGEALSYAISGGNTNGAFSINASTGAITVAKKLNYHTQSRYTLTVQATDAGGASGNATVAITVNEGASVPSFTSLNWGTAASQPYGTHEVHGSVVNGKLYVFGGYDAQKQPSWTPTKKAIVYDPAANTWRSIADLPHTPNGSGFGGITHEGLTTDGTDIYFAGGYTSNSTGTGQIFGTKQVWKYHVATNTYSALPNLPEELAAGQLQYLQGKIHYIGGANKARLDVAVHYALDLDNLAAGWKALAPLSNPRNHPGSAVYGGKIYFIGGAHHQDDNTVTQKTLEVYDPAVNTWTRAADMPTGLDHISSSVVVMGNRILVLGGESSHNVKVNTVLAYTPSENSWTRLTSLPTSTSAGVAAVINNVLYYTGGNFSRSNRKGVPLQSTTQQQVASFTLFDANTKQAIQTLADGTTLNLAALPTKNLNIRANTNPATVGSVVFALSGAEGKNATESKAPYDLMGDNGAWTPAAGTYTLKATPYTASGGSGTPGSALTITFSVVDQANSSGLISNISSTSGKSYALASLAVGVRPYTDRTYQITSVPSLLSGASLVQTANDDKKYAGATLLTFTLSQSATVYIAYDPRATALPSWLSGWQKLTDRVGVNDSKISHMELYSKTFAAGQVTLGGNMQSPAAGAENNYFVVAKASDQGAVLSSSGFYEVGNVEMIAYPNPNTGDRIYLLVNNLRSYEPVTITMQDILGRSVTSFDLTTDAFGSVRTEIPRGKHLGKGLYIIRASATSGRAQSKLLVE